MTVGLAYLENLKRAKAALEPLTMDYDVPLKILQPAERLKWVIEQEILQQSLRLSVQANIKKVEAIFGLADPCDDCGCPFSKHVDGGACAEPRCWCGEFKPKPKSKLGLIHAPNFIEQSERAAELAFGHGCGEPTCSGPQDHNPIERCPDCGREHAYLTSCSQHASDLAITPDPERETLHMGPDE